MNLQWNVFIHNFNSKTIEPYNIFNHGRFREDVKRHLKDCMSKECFAEMLKRELRYYFWGKYEWEVIITSFPTRIASSELKRLNAQYKNDTERCGHPMNNLSVNLDIESKIDVYEQIMTNFDRFVDYIWSEKVW